MGYIIGLFLILATYIFAVIFMGRPKNTKLWNPVFILTVVSFYIASMITIYRSVGFYDWNFQNTLPTANVSPFMFTLAPLTYLFPKKIRKYLYLLVTLLSVGMILSPVFNCLYNYSISYAFHIHFFYDYIAHAVLSLWGVYMLRSEQVELNVKNALISSSVIIGVATLMISLNVIFDKAFFGLSLNGKHSIYNNVIVDNSYLSALLYFTGLCGVLLMGYGYSKLIGKLNKNEK